MTDVVWILGQQFELVGEGDDQQYQSKEGAPIHVTLRLILLHIFFSPIIPLFFSHDHILTQYEGNTVQLGIRHALKQLGCCDSRQKST